jgi:hypothetical protein
MPSKLFNQIVQQASSLDTAIAAEGTHDNSKMKTTETKPVKEEEKSASAIQSQIDSMLFFDKAFSNRTEHIHKSLNRRQKDMEKIKKRIKRCRTKGVATGNSRSSSSSYALKANVPTYNKKRHLKEKKIKDLEHLAKMLRKSKK